MGGIEFTEEQKHYLEGFTAGSGLAKTLLDLAAPKPAPPAEEKPVGPEAIHRVAQDRFTKTGKKLVPEEQAKRKKHPLDFWDEVRAHARDGKFPKGTDVFLFKFQGLFYVAPAQDSFMCRLRFPCGIVSSHQLRGVADLAERYGGGYADITTRANLQIREIKTTDTVNVLHGLHDVGIINRGAGADNVRNITGSPTAGIDPQELIDVRPLAKELHHYILNHRELYGLPRKFNVCFDGGGSVGTVSDTNDIGFIAVRVGEGKGVKPGVYFRMQLGGITGHKDFARDAGLLLEPEQCLPAAVAAIRVFIDHGDRTDRKKARLKYVLDQWGIEKYVEEMKRYLPFEAARVPLEACEPPEPPQRLAHMGFHPQKQAGMYYCGVVIPVGRLTVAQMRGLAAMAERHGSGTIRLTVWQNLLISDIPQGRIEAVKGELRALDLDWAPSAIRSALVACTGNTGCKFSATHTKKHALDIARHVDAKVELDQPVNVHLTGCPHSCAQHYIAEIGMLGTKIAVGEQMVEGYHVYVGGGCGTEQGLGREVARDVPAEDAGPLVERMVRAYLEHRIDASESFGSFSRRHSIEQLKDMFDARKETAAAVAAR